MYSELSAEPQPKERILAWEKGQYEILELLAPKQEDLRICALSLLRSKNKTPPECIEMDPEAHETVLHKEVQASLL